MPRAGVLGVLVAVGLLLGGCGGDDSGAGKITAGAVDADEANATNYDVAYDVCASLTPEELAEQNAAASTAPEDIATAYAAPYRQDLRQASYDGCLDALEGRPKSP